MSLMATLSWILSSYLIPYKSHTLALYHERGRETLCCTVLQRSIPHGLVHKMARLGWWLYSKENR